MSDVLEERRLLAELTIWQPPEPPDDAPDQEFEPEDPTEELEPMDLRLVSKMVVIAIVSLYVVVWIGLKLCGFV